MEADAGASPLLRGLFRQRRAPWKTRRACRRDLYILSYLSILDTEWERAMRYVSATEAKQALAAVLDAAQREPVVIRRQQRDVAVVLSMHEYERLTALNVEEFQRFCDRIGEQAKARGLTEEKLTEVLASDA